MSGSHAWTLSGGSFRPGAEIPLTDRGFRYGMSVFETIAVRRGVLLFWDAHIRRLRAACAAAGFPADLPDACDAILPLPDGMLRIYVTAGDGSPVQPAEGCRTYALFDAMTMPSEEDCRRGYAVTQSRAPVAAVLGGWKTGCYWPRIQALSVARQEGFDEVLVADGQGALVSAAMANVFVVREGILRTPAPGCGARDGVVRDWVRSRAAAEESLLTFDDLDAAEEIFLTNSRIGVMPVASLDGRPLASRTRANALAELYREEILGA